MAAEVDLAEQLHPARLPADFFSVSIQDLLAAFGVGILVAVALYFMLRPFVRRQVSALARVTTQLRDSRTLPSQERVFRQAAILDELRGNDEQNDDQDSEAETQATDWKEALYRPGVAVDHDALDDRILRIAARVKS